MEANMDPLTIGLITGGANLLGSMFSSNTSAQNTQAQLQAQQQMQMQSEAFNSAEAGKSRDFSAAQAGVQRDYETQMSNTAYQRASADMQKAGLNPMMMFGSGSAASSPAGAMGSSSAASVGTPSAPTPTRTSPLAGLGDAVSRGLQSAINVKQVEKMSDEIANLQTERLKIAAETRTEAKRPENVSADTLIKMNEAQHKAALFPVSQLAGKSAKDVLDLPDWLRNAANVGGFLGEKTSKTIEPITDLISSAFKSRFYFGVH